MAERGSQSTTMIGSWRSLGLLGRGGTATVLEVEGIGGGRRRALKLAHDRGCSGAILAEVAALSTLYHPAIPSIDACGIDDEGRAWLVREPIDGQALDEVIASRRADPRVLRDLLDQCLELFRYLDAQGRCHGDIKPQNILVEGEGDELRLRVLDLGAEAEVMTPMYATPERLSEERAPRLSDDLFALAVSFWQGLTGAHPYPGYPAELPEAGTPGVDADPEAGLNEIADFLRPLLLLEVGARLSSLQHVLRHREGLWPDAAALPLEASLRHRLCHAPFVPLADESPGREAVSGGGSFSAPCLVQLHCPTQGASIGYTLGEGEAAAWQLYTEPLRLPAGTPRVRARAVRIGFAESAETSAAFTIHDGTEPRRRS